MSRAFIINVILAFNIYNALCMNVDSDQKVLSRRKRFVVFPTGSSFSVAACMTVGVYGNPQFSMFSWGVNYGFAYNLPSNASYFLHPPKDIINFPFFDSSEDEKKPTTTTTTTENIFYPPENFTEGFEENSIVDSHLRRNSIFTQELSPYTRYNNNNNNKIYPVYYPPKIETKPMMQRRYRRDIYRNIETVLDRLGYNGRDCILRALCESPQLLHTIEKRSMVQELIKTVFSFPKSKVLNFEPSRPELIVYDEAHRRGRRDKDDDCGQRYSHCGFSLIELALGKHSSNSPQFDFM